MMFLVFFPLLIVGALCEDNCIDLGLGILHCYSLELHPDEPVYINDSFSTIHLDIVTGSIGDKTLSSLPRLKRIRIERSNITVVQDGAFCSLPNLEAIIVNANEKFPRITDSIFDNCEKLEYLQLGDVEIEPTAFKKLTSLRVLVLERFNLERLQQEFLKPLSQLEGLKFNECEIKEIDPGSLCSSSKLKDISMVSNKYWPPLTKEMFENCGNVREFDYLFNAVTSLEEKTFNGFVNLKSLDSNCLKIDHLNQNHLEGLSNLTSLRLDHAGIETIEIGAFEGLVNLERLRLRNNNLRQIDSSVFSHLTSLKELSLGDNKIEGIDSFTHTNLQILDVSRNNISMMDADAVKLHLPKLDRLAAAHNNMTSEYEERLRVKFKSYNIDFLLLPYFLR